MIRAIFWDIDGTLTDDKIHKAKHRILAEKAGYMISESEGMQLNGVNDNNTYDYLSNKLPSFLSFYPCVEDYLIACRNFFELFAADSNSDFRVKARQGALACVTQIKKLGIAQACITSAPEWQANLNLSALNISNDILFVQTLDEGVKPKPNLDLYQLAFAKIKKICPHIQKSEILVIEDSVSGVSAAYAAGLQVIQCRMNELAPMNPQTLLHAFSFEQVMEIMKEKFDVCLNLNTENEIKNDLELHKKTIFTETRKLFEERNNLPFFKNSIKPPQESYCGFKPGFLLGKRF